jgi:hypothetical protein
MFYFYILKEKSYEGSVCTHVHQKLFARKPMTIVLWERKEVFVVELIQHCTTVTSEVYACR